MSDTKTISREDVIQFIENMTVLDLFQTVLQDHLNRIGLLSHSGLPQVPIQH